MTFTISPLNEPSFLRLIDIGFVTSEQDKREFTQEEWLGKKDAKGNTLVSGVNPAIRHRLMCDHIVTVVL